MGRTVERIWPKMVRNVGAMRDSDVVVKAVCGTCQNQFRIDLDMLCAMRGRGYSLIGKRGKCKLYDCDGSCVFLYQAGRGVPFMPLKD